MAFNPSPWTARIISPATSDTNPSVLVTFSDAKYLFNCPESITRTFIQRKYGFNKFRSIFLSRVASDTSAGLPGFLMTLADSGTRKLQAYGPPGLLHFVASARTYLVRDSLELTVVENGEDASQPIFKDDNLTVYAIQVYANEVQSDGEKVNSGSPSLKRKHPDASKNDRSPKRLSIGSDLHKYRESPFRLQNEEAQSWRRLVVSRMLPGKGGIPFSANHKISRHHLKNRLPSWGHRPVATSYLAFGPEYRGKFNSSIADSLGVPPGRDRGRLAKGESVTLPDGRVITPDMVLGSSSPAMAFIVVDCPSAEFIPGLIASKQLNGLEGGQRYQLHCVVHITPHEVYNDPRYAEWMAQFGSQVHHIVANHSVCSNDTVFKSSEEMQKHLSVLDQSIFRQPHFRKTSLASIQGQVDPDSTLKVYPASYQIIGMRPVTDPSDLSSESVAATGAVTDIQSEKIFKGVKDKVEAVLPPSDPFPGDDVSISCFGTGSAMPGKYRNVSGTLVQIPDKGGILLDCGEGTIGQIRRHFGEEAESVLRNLTCVFLSHIHGDHHIGASSLLVARRNLFPPPQKPLYVIATGYAINYLLEYAEIEDLGLRQPNGIRFISADSLDYMIPDVSDPERAEALAAVADLQADLDLESIKTAAVEHRTLAYGLVIRHKDGWSLTYSGDTMPCQNLVNAGRNSTVLIHEATMADDQAALAEEKTHSTIGQAIDIAHRMRAKKLLLTHFSGRYPKIPVLNRGTPAKSTVEGETQWAPETFIAFDLLHIRLGDFQKAERYLPALEAAFAELKDDEITVQ